MTRELPLTAQEAAPETVVLPSPTAWPIVLAFGGTLLFAGLLTTASVSILGAILVACGCVGWFRDVLPHEKHELIAVTEAPPVVATSRSRVARASWITHDLHRARLPLEIYPVSAGVKGGLAGSVIMAILAIAYGLIFRHSVWYPINLLAAGFFPASDKTSAQLNDFQPTYLIIAIIIHLVTSVLVGLLYGAMLPMVPRRPILLGGFVAPVLWSGLIHSFVNFLNPVLSKQIDWPWFVFSQIGFGIVAGLVVSSQHRVHTWQHLPFAIRAGFETQGPEHEGDEKDSGR